MTELQKNGVTLYFDSSTELLLAVKNIVKETEVVADIGCGIVPMHYFRPKLHFMVEPWKEYSDILTYRHAYDKSVVILRNGAIEALRSFADNSVDSIFLLDVIEHLEKEEGQQVLVECERVAREQIVIFTPLGFMPQHMESDEADGWGLSGTSVQEHRSGWTPDDFSSNWSFYICNEFHRMDFKGIPLEQPFGAFFAIRNFEGKTVLIPEKLSEFRRVLPVELAMQNLQGDFNNLQGDYQILLVEHKNQQVGMQNLQGDFNNLQGDYQSLLVKHKNQQVDMQNLQGDFNNLQGDYQNLLVKHKNQQVEYKNMQDELMKSRLYKIERYIRRFLKSN